MTRVISLGLTMRGCALLLLLAGALACSRDPVGPATASAPGARPNALTPAAADGLIVFDAHAWGSTISTMNPDGSSPTEVTNNFPDPPTDDVHAQLSPDGSKIVFQRGTWYPVVGVTTDIYTINPDGSGLTNLTNSPDYSEGEPTWSPDGSKIAFKSNRDDSSYSLFTMNSDGSNVTKIVATLIGGYESREPTWSPDGTQIAYTTNALEPYWLLCIVTIAGGGTSCATTPSTRFGNDIGGIGGTMGSFFNPDWGPDGRIAVTGQWGECSGCHRNDIFLIDPDFTNLTKISGVNVFDGKGYFFPSWSPDGIEIAYQEDQGSGTAGIGVMNADGTGKTIIRAGWNTAPHWGVDAGAPPPPQCSDGVDNDGDGKVDFPADPGCGSAADDSESPDPQPTPQCKDGVDNDGDGKVDFPADPGCTSRGDNDESNDPPPPPQCSDGVDNDGDGKVDHPADPGCSSSDDDSESPDPQPAAPQCRDGIDNDGDGRTDYPADMSCRRSTDATESPDLCEQHAIFTGQLMQRMYDVWEPGLGEKSRENIHTSVRFGLQQRPRHIVWYFRPHLDFFEKRNAESCGNPLTTYCDQERLRVFQEEFAILQTVCSEDWINRQ